MKKLARDVMTSDPVCCAPHATLDDIAKLMAQHNCGEIPIVDSANRPIGVVTDRDIVCRVVAAGKNPLAHTAAECMSQPVVTVGMGEPIETVIATMESRQLRRVPVLDDDGCCVGIIAQADIAREEPWTEVAALVREVSLDDSRLVRR